LKRPADTAEARRNATNAGLQVILGTAVDQPANCSDSVSLIPHGAGDNAGARDIASEGD
jgi:hypothetical protein